MSVEFPCMDPDIGLQLSSAQLDEVLRGVAKAFSPSPAEADMVTTYSFPGCTTTPRSVVATPFEDQADLGGWVGLGVDAEASGTGTRATAALRRGINKSTPRNYNGQHGENERYQKVLHIAGMWPPAVRRELTGVGQLLACPVRV